MGVRAPLAEYSQELPSVHCRSAGGALGPKKRPGAAWLTAKQRNEGADASKSAVGSFSTIHQTAPVSANQASQTVTSRCETLAQFMIFQSVDTEPNETASARVVPSISQR